MCLIPNVQITLFVHDSSYSLIMYDWTIDNKSKESSQNFHTGHWIKEWLLFWVKWGSSYAFQMFSEEAILFLLYRSLYRKSNNCYRQIVKYYMLQLIALSVKCLLVLTR
jgi:hypothetical protein